MTESTTDIAFEKNIDKLKQETSFLKQKRVSQTEIIPGAVKARHIGEGPRFTRSGLEADLPESGENATDSNAVYYATDTDTYYIWNGTAWTPQVNTDGSQTLNNKILTSPTINTPTLILANTSPTVDGSIGYDRAEEELQIGDGTNSLFIRMGAWKSWTPQWTNLTVGNATNTGFYCQIGKTIIFKTTLTLGNTSSVGTIPGLTLPVTAKTQSVVPIGQTMYITNDNYLGWIDAYGILRIGNVIGTGAGKIVLANLSATVPYTWTTNHVILTTGTYEAA